MTLADSAKAQNELTAARRRTGLVGMPDNAGIEQSRGFKRILIEKICADQAPLRLVQFGMRRERILHLRRTCIKGVQQISVAALEIFQHIVQLLRRDLGVKLQNPVDDMVGARLISRIEVSRFDRRFEGSDDDPGRIWA